MITAQLHELSISYERKYFLALLSWGQRAKHDIAAAFQV